MFLCRRCKRKIAAAGNPQTIYSNCSDCQYNNKKEDKEEEWVIWKKD